MCASLVSLAAADALGRPHDGKRSKPAGATTPSVVSTATVPSAAVVGAAENAAATASAEVSASATTTIGAFDAQIASAGQVAPIETSGQDASAASRMVRASAPATVALGVGSSVGRDADAADAPDEVRRLRHGPWGRRLHALSKAFALAGGVLFIALIAMSLVSIVGRKLFSLPVPGDFEVLQMGAAVAIASFFAYCQMTDSHLRVDFFTTWMPPRLRAALDGLAALLMAAVAVLLAWRTAAAALSSHASGEVSLMLGWPGWIAIALIVPSLVLFALTSSYIAARRLGLAAGVER
jgi:TRAP-type C4-dicarboxylate transport system permease small subunit